MYIIMDGFDLGVGILFPLFAINTRSRCYGELGRAGMGRGAKLWLVLGGAGLLARSRWLMPSSPTLTIPLVVMLLGLIFRGVAF